ncbi:MAG TPA: protein kinase [Longimicrobiales bacterium]
MRLPDPERWAQIEALFTEAVALGTAERAAFLAARTDDPGLRREVQRLLDANDRAGGFLGELDTERAAALVGSADAEEDHTIGPYRVLHRLAAGGMGVVYLAEDSRLDRRVALKLLPPYLSGDATAQRRFTEEAKAASALDHPHIATIYEIGRTSAERLYIAMAYYEGETLRQRLERGPLPVGEAVDLAAQTAAGLAAAHARGIVHRDIKPANVIVAPPAPGQSPGVVKILDFGVAKMAGDALTRTGATLGTVAYMSPEQTRGEGVDHRTDLWSLGAMLYEMLAGTRPFRAENEQALIYAVRHDQPRPLQELRPDVPETVVRVVERCLAKEPEDRYTDAGALLDELRGIATAARPRPAPAWSRTAVRYGGAAASVLLLAAAAYAFWPRTPGAVGPAPSLRSEADPLPRSRIAVLPLADYSSDARDDYFADGLTEELISQVSKLGGLRVIARTSVVPYRASDKSVAEIARELRAGTVLEGSVRRDGNRVRITVQLIDARTEEQLWSDDYDAELADVIGVQTSIATKVAEALDVQLRQDERRQLARRATVDPEAYRLYLEGRHFWNKRDIESFRKAVTLFREAVDRDPLYAPAWAGLADSYEMLSSSMNSPEQAIQVARAAAERALAIDADLAEAHTALATILLNQELDWSEAERHFRQALALNPSYALAHQRYSALLAGTGRLDEAVRSSQRAQELDPLSLYARASAGYNLYLARRYAEARVQLEATRDLDPDFGLTHLNLVLLHLQTRSYDRALAAARTLHSLWGDTPTVLGLLGHAFAMSGQPEEAARILRQLNARTADQPASFHAAVLRLGLGELDEAVALLEQAVARRSSGLLVYLPVEPLFDPLRSHPRFRALLEKMGPAPDADG